jgi:ABC-type transport system involved in cytochrome bd biosynthesis fused ATPase/permease subunit
LKITRIEESVGPVIKVISACVAAIILYAGAFLVNKNHSLLAEDLVRFLTAAGLIQAPLRNMSHAGVQIQRISAGAMRIVSLFNIPFDQLSIDQSKHIQSHKNYPIPQKPLALEFQNVSFAYPQQNLEGAESTPNPAPYALNNINLKLEARKKIALVGKSGSGKTTLAKEFINIYALQHNVDPNDSELFLWLESNVDRGIHTIRAKLADFTRGACKVPGVRRWIIIDDADTLPEVSQQALRRPMEQYAYLTCFLFIAKNTDCLIHALQSRCQPVSFSPIPLQFVFKTIFWLLNLSFL